MIFILNTIALARWHPHRQALSHLRTDGRSADMSETPESGEFAPIPAPQADSGPGQPGTGEPGSGQADPGIGQPGPSQEAAPSDQQPYFADPAAQGATSGPTAGYGQPGADDPTAEFGQPGAGAYAPPGGYGQPGAGDPTAAYGQPGAYGQPWQQPVPVDLRTVTGPAPVLVSFPEPAPQARLTVAFRALLAIPHGVVLFVLAIAALVVAIIGWFAALFTGELPQWAHGFLTGFVRWSTRVSAYQYFLTDTYPPFSLDDTDYPVRLLTKPTRLNRLAVLFRYFLALPVALVSGLAVFGLEILSPIAWLITLIAGRMPRPLHEAFAAIIRFYARYSGYYWMLSPEYPAGLFGDRPEPAADAALSGAESSQEANQWRLVLSQAAKTLVAVSLVLGLGGFITYFVVVFSSANSVVSRADALVAVTNDYNQLNTEFARIPGQIQACQRSLTCVTTLDGRAAQQLQTFRTGILNANIPSSSSAQANALLADTSKVANDFSQLATAQSATQYQAIASGLSLQADLNQVQSAYVQLSNSLRV
jgi:hypothetical protein